MNSGNTASAQFLDPAISEEKFAAEVAHYRMALREHQRRGWFLIDASFPSVFVLMASAKVRPSGIVCGVEIDFTNYDFVPPSVRLVDPFTRQPYKAKELPTTLQRRKVTAVELAPGGPKVEQVEITPLMQWYSLEEVPFLCVPGVREYHDNPAHTGDSWLLHRQTEPGLLYRLLHVVYQYGVQPIRDYSIGIKVTGFNQSEPPL